MKTTGMKKKILSENFKSSGKVYFLKEIELTSRKEIEETFNKTIIDGNEEGLIVRGENGPVFKIKDITLSIWLFLAMSMDTQKTTLDERSFSRRDDRRKSISCYRCCS